ncbi:hypothetical protein AZE42_04503 [Rhizopogon vesiculosus]|uniref:NADP-dependent oxidoreductase domain-containing protein n=1 Tax=Rhizopogon vesiculosus TaxID=180088 RepID=A0A1J8PVS2_9AGAM|nr:hypothetical protein AZE42_04503 [Rhizopogon vesiculosus]
MSITVQYRTLGKAGLKVSVLILGAMSYGTPKWAPWVLEEEPSLEIMKAAWDLGINTIDTANMYSNGESERLISKFLKKRPTEYVNQSGLSRAAIFNAVNASLARLETTYIDLLQIHRFDPAVTPEEIMKTLHDLVQSGKVRYIGASSMRCWQFAMLNDVAAKNGWTKFVSMQNEYSLVYREEEREMMVYCKYNGIGVIPWSPLATGFLARPAGTETIRVNSSKGTPREKKLIGGDTTIVNRVEELAQKKNCKMSQISLAWAAAKVTSPIVGVNSIQRLRESITTGIELTAEEMVYLEEPYEPKVVRGHL